MTDTPDIFTNPVLGKLAAAAVLQRLPDIPPEVAAILAAAAFGEQ